MDDANNTPADGHAPERVPFPVSRALAAACEERDRALARAARLAAALKPFADFAEAMDSSAHTPHIDDFVPMTRWLLWPAMKHARDARDALAAAGGERVGPDHEVGGEGG